jgi:uncharacterized protein YjbI with pentapeptide repeats
MAIEVRLKKLKKRELVNLARNLKSSGYSKLKKNELIDHIIGNYSEQEITAILNVFDKGACGYIITMDGKPCGKHLYDEEHCIFHSGDIEGKKVEFDNEFWKEFERQKEHEEFFDFTGFVFPGSISFERIIFEKGTIFWKAQFSGMANFWKAQFSKEAYFRDSQFSGKAYIVAKFSGEANFESAQFSGDVSFGSQFSGEANFESAKFSGEANFESAQFSGKTNFGKAEFSGEADFHRSQFSKNANFESTKFFKEVNFGYSQFYKEADFRGSQFSKNANFWSAQFFREVNFGSATFSGEANFESAQFSGMAIFGSQFFGMGNFRKAKFTCANFYNARFSGANFCSAQFSGEAFFESAQFSGEANFEKVQFYHEANFWRSKFTGDSNFSDVYFKDFNQCNMIDTTFYNVSGFLEYLAKNKKKIKHPRGIKYLHDDCKPILGEATVSRLPLLSREIRDDVYLMSFKDKHPRLHFLWWLFADCGSSFLRWALWSMVFAFAFAIIFNAYYQDYNLNFNSVYISQEYPLFSFLYYSLVTFTTLGFGDIVPTNGWLQFWVALEVVIGYIMLGGLISILANKLARRS